jgi:hypothetical protein
MKLEGPFFSCYMHKNGRQYEYINEGKEKNVLINGRKQSISMIK